MPHLSLESDIFNMPPSQYVPKMNMENGPLEHLGRLASSPSSTKQWFSNGFQVTCSSSRVYPESEPQTLRCLNNGPPGAYSGGDWNL